MPRGGCTSNIFPDLPLAMQEAPPRRIDRSLDDTVGYHPITPLTESKRPTQADKRHWSYIEREGRVRLFVCNYMRAKYRFEKKKTVPMTWVPGSDLQLK